MASRRLSAVLIAADGLAVVVNIPAQSAYGAAALATRRPNFKSAGSCERFGGVGQDAQFARASSRVLRQSRRGIAEPLIVAFDRRQFGDPASLQKPVQGCLNARLCDFGAAVAHPGVLELGLDDADAILLGLLGTLAAHRDRS